MWTKVGKFSICLFIVCQTGTVALAQKCDASIMESAPQSLALLQAEQDSRQDPECIKFAIYGIEGTRTPEVVDLLLKYLDFRRPDTKAEKGGMRRSFRDVEDMYPAVSALFLMGDLAVPKLMSTVAADKTAELSRKNALEAFMLIYRTDQSQGIALLREQAWQRKDDKEKLRLLTAAQDAIALCYEEQREKCSTVASKD